MRLTSGGRTCSAYRAVGGAAGGAVWCWLADGELVGAGKMTKLVAENGFSRFLKSPRKETPGIAAALGRTTTQVMNWIVLILAGLCECGFAFCLGTAYPVWTGIGAVGTVLLGILVFKEPATFWRLFFTFTLIASIIGLKVVQ